ncbi:hypothetical protein HanIR_Chr01g0027791 [Helianthus annuus]|nr:hypothetical protein HanIR_Chr01g0027791 [Helianthus annuus]
MIYIHTKYVLWSTLHPQPTFDLFFTIVDARIVGYNYVSVFNLNNLYKKILLHYK